MPELDVREGAPKRREHAVEVALGGEVVAAVVQQPHVAARLGRHPLEELAHLARRRGRCRWRAACGRARSPRGPGTRRCSSRRTGGRPARPCRRAPPRSTRGPGPSISSRVAAGVDERVDAREATGSGAAARRGRRRRARSRPAGRARSATATLPAEQEVADRGLGRDQELVRQHVEGAERQGTRPRRGAGCAPRPGAARPGGLRARSPGRRGRSAGSRSRPPARRARRPRCGRA